MDEKAYSNVVKRLQKANTVISKLDPAIRSEAFSLLRPYITGAGSDKEVGPSGSEESGDSAAKEFLKEHEKEKPSDNVLAAGAFLYSQYGSAPFPTKLMKKLADDAGVTIPSRVDVTVKHAQRDGKPLFCAAGRGKFRPTVHGEKFFKETYKVKKGTKQMPSNKGKK